MPYLSMSKEQEATLVLALDNLEGKVGAQHYMPFEGCRFLFMATNQDGFHSGRRRYLVVCCTHEKLLHEATTGPVSRVNQHINEILREREGT